MLWILVRITNLRPLQGVCPHQNGAAAANGTFPHLVFIQFICFGYSHNQKMGRHGTKPQTEDWHETESPSRCHLCHSLWGQCIEGDISQVFPGALPVQEQAKAAPSNTRLAPNSSKVFDLGLNRHTEFPVLVNCAVLGSGWPRLWASVQWGTGDVGHEPRTAGISQPINTARYPGDLSDVKGACGYLLIEMWKPRGMTEDVRAASLTPVQNT